MAITEGVRMSQLVHCVEHAHHFLLDRAEAVRIIDHQLEVVRSQWSEVCDLAELGRTDRDYFWQRQFLNPCALEGYGGCGRRETGSGRTPDATAGGLRIST